MLITSKQRRNHLFHMPSPSINEAPIKNVPVFVDENLSWNTHVDKVSKTIAAGIGAIKRMKPLFHTFNP